MRFITLLPWTLALLCAALRAEPVDSLVTAGDWMKINRPASPVLSPDAKLIAYTVRSLEERLSGDALDRSRLWLATTDGSAVPRELSVAGDHVHSPAWHPVGDRLAYIQLEADDRARIWVLSVAGGDPVAVTPPLRGVNHPRWSRDGSRLIFTAVVAESEARAALEKEGRTDLTPPWADEKPALPAEPEPAPANAPKPADTKTPPAPPPPSPNGNLASRRAWLAENSARHSPTVTNRPDLTAGLAGDGELEFTHIFLVEKAGAAPTDLTPGFVSYSHPEWLPDHSIVCSGPSDTTLHPDRHSKKQLFTLKPDEKTPRPLGSSGDFSLDHPAVSPDGKRIACTAQLTKAPGDATYGQTRIATIDLADGKLKITTAKFDRSARQPAWSADGQFIYFTAATGGAIPIHRVPAAGGNVERITTTDTWIGDVSVGAEDLVFMSSRAANPGELYRTRLNGRSSRILTFHNSEWLRDKKLTNPERRKFKQPDGVEIDYWMARPPYLEGGFHYPLLVIIHDGPAEMWGAGNPGMWHDLQFFAARGYVVVFANFRGSSGYGEKFQRANFQHWAPGPAGDVIAVADAVAKDNWVDRDRQVILGEGYGGYLAAWILSIDQRFKAAAVANGVYQLNLFNGVTGGQTTTLENFGGYPWQPDIRKLLDAQSPLTRVNSINTPMLIRHDAGDSQSGLAQGELLYCSLKLLGRPAEFIRYPKPEYTPDRTSESKRNIDRIVRLDEFFQRFIGTPAKPVPLPPVAPAPPPPPAPTPTPKPEMPAAPAPADAMMGGGGMNMMSN